MKNNTNGMKAAILSMSVVQMGTNAISPILADIASAFPEADTSIIQFLMTFPSLMVLFFSLFSSMISHWISKKLLSATGCILFCLSGILSFVFNDNLYLLFIWAGIMGVGIGLVIPMATSLISDWFDSNEEAQLMGLQSTAANLGAMLMTFFGGLLASIHWSYNYLVYLIAIPGIFLTLVYLPAHTPKVDDTSHSNATKITIFSLIKNKTILISCILAFIVTMLFNTIPTNLSMLLSEKQIGTSSTSGTGTTLLLLSGAIGGLCFGKLSKLLGKYITVFGFSMLAIGQLLCATSSEISFIFIGCLIAGCSISTVMPQATISATSHAQENTATASALVMGSSNLGGFCAPLLTLFSHFVSASDSVAPRFVLSISFACIVIIVILFCLSKKR